MRRLNSVWEGRGGLGTYERLARENMERMVAAGGDDMMNISFSLCIFGKLRISMWRTGHAEYLMANKSMISN